MWAGPVATDALSGSQHPVARLAACLPTRSSCSSRYTPASPPRPPHRCAPPSLRWLTTTRCLWRLRAAPPTTPLFSRCDAQGLGSGSASLTRCLRLRTQAGRQAGWLAGQHAAGGNRLKVNQGGGMIAPDAATVVVPRTAATEPGATMPLPLVDIQVIAPSARFHTPYGAGAAGASGRHPAGCRRWLPAAGTAAVL